MIRIWLLKIYLGWSFLWLSIQFVSRLRDSESDGRGQLISLQVSGQCLASHWSDTGNQALSLADTLPALGRPLTLAMHNCRTQDMFVLFFTQDMF